MDIKGGIKEFSSIDVWWKAVLIIGIVLFICSMAFDLFIERRYIAGLGIGLIMIGISNWIALVYKNHILPGGILTVPTYKHNGLTKILFVVGILLSLYFLIVILVSLF